MESNILGLSGFFVSRVQENEADYLITARYKPTPDVCPRCGIDQPSVYKHGVLRQKVWDVPNHGKRTLILLDRQRYRCRTCGQTFNEGIDALDEQRFMTKRLARYIEKRALSQTFVQIERDTGVTEATARNVFGAWYEAENKRYRPATPRVIGIDEVAVLRRPRCIITNIEAQTVVDLLTDRDQETVLKRLARLRTDRNQVDLVAIDMWRPYYNAARKTWPFAQIVVDKFHVVRMASDALEVFRRSYNASLPEERRKGLKRDRFIMGKRAQNYGN